MYYSTWPKSGPKGVTVVCFHPCLLCGHHRQCHLLFLFDKFLLFETHIVFLLLYLHLHSHHHHLPKPWTLCFQQLVQISKKPCHHFLMFIFWSPLSMFYFIFTWVIFFCLKPTLTSSSSICTLVHTFTIFT